MYESVDYCISWMGKFCRFLLKEIIREIVNVIVSRYNPYFKCIRAELDIGPNIRFIFQFYE